MWIVCPVDELYSGMCRRWRLAIRRRLSLKVVQQNLAAGDARAMAEAVLEVLCLPRAICEQPRRASPTRPG
jgi:hypothetical protein